MSKVTSLLALLLILVLASSVFAQDDLDGGQLTYDETVEVDTDDVNTVTFTFDASEGDVINIVVDSQDDVDSTLTLLNPDGDELVTDDEGGSYPNPALFRYPLPEAGTYTLVIAGYGDSELGGDFEVTVEQTELLLLNDGEFSITLDDRDQPADVMALDVEEGQQYIVTVSFEDPSDSTLYIEFEEEGDFYPNTRVAISGVSATSFLFEADQDGRAMVKFEFTGYDEEIEITVSAEAAE